MEDNEHPALSLAQKFFVDQLGASNQFSNELLLSVQNALVKEIPAEKEKIEKILQRFQYPFSSCSSLINKSSKMIKLPVSVMMRENEQEHKEGIYAVSVTENLGINVLEDCCRKIVLIPDEIRLVEARKLEPELNCFCTIPKFLHQTEVIEAGAKYELVFEKNQPPKVLYAIHRNIVNQKNVQKPASQLNFHSNGASSSKYQEDFLNEPSHSNELSPSFETTGNFVTENELLSKLFSRDNNSDFNNALPDSDLTATTSNWVNKDVDSVKFLPEFEPLDIFTQEPRARSILDYLKRHKMDINGKVRINFVQIIGKYYLEEIKPKLDGPSTAALRRAFIDKVFSALNRVIKPLPPQEDFSNRLGKGFFDIYLKHQNTKTRRQMSQSTSGKPEDFGRKLIEQIDRMERTSNSPGQSSLKSENYESFD